ncbi:hypothetical protein U1Q18_019002 [Sarracenia purpurea var. burkii]
MADKLAVSTVVDPVLLISVGLASIAQELIGIVGLRQRGDGERVAMPFLLKGARQQGAAEMTLETAITAVITVNGYASQDLARLAQELRSERNRNYHHTQLVSVARVVHNRGQLSASDEGFEDALRTLFIEVFVILRSTVIALHYLRKRILFVWDCLEKLWVVLGPDFLLVWQLRTVFVKGELALIALVS